MGGMSGMAHRPTPRISAAADRAAPSTYSDRENCLKKQNTFRIGRAFPETNESLTLIGLGEILRS
jgi:hypothetical protein